MPRKKGSNKRMLISKAMKAFHAKNTTDADDETTCEVGEVGVAREDPGVLAPADCGDDEMAGPSVYIPTNFFYKSNVVQTYGLFNDSDSENEFSLLLSDDETASPPAIDDDNVEVDEDKQTQVELSSADRRSKLIENYINERKQCLLSNSDNDELLILSKKQTKAAMNKLMCSVCYERVEIEIVKRNLDSDLVVKCGCEKPEVYEHEKVKDCDNVKTNNIGAVTAAVVYQNVLNGGGLAAINNTTAALSMKPLSNSTYQRYKKYIECLAEILYKKTREEVDNSIRRQYESLGFQADEDGIMDIEVMYDGTWMKRGHRSPIGMGVITEACTGFVMDAEVYSKICNACNTMNSNFRKEKITKEQHEENM